MTTPPGARHETAVPGGVITRRAAATPFEVHLDVFSGPFDLLLGLISRRGLAGGGRVGRPVAPGRTLPLVGGGGGGGPGAGEGRARGPGDRYHHKICVVIVPG